MLNLLIAPYVFARNRPRCFSAFNVAFMDHYFLKKYFAQFSESHKFWIGSYLLSSPQPQQLKPRPY